MSISRRHFLQTVIAAASATTLPMLSGCDFDSDSDSSNNEPRDTGITNYFPQSVMSGDPRSNSVILWTRVEDADIRGKINLTLQVSEDSSFATGVVNTTVSAMAEHDYAVKVRVTELKPYTTYYYRFVYSKNGEDKVTNTGRTKTAPESNADVDVKFAYASCQDYIGRYYNTYLRLLEQDMLDSIDFVVHLGDYIYETVGDKSFQAASDDRNITFTDIDGALKIGAEGKEFYAAQSLSNYRQLYKEYRTDETLQKMQESYPFIVTWDDHEFSDDSWQNNGTYLDAAITEKNAARKKNSEQAYLEFMPIDHETVGDETSTDAGVISIGDEHLGDNIKIFRDFQFGQNVHLVMSDYRSYRPDHLIPEDAFPGSVAMTEEELNAFLPAVINDDATRAVFQANMQPYVSGETLKGLLGDSYVKFEYALTMALKGDAAKRGYDLAFQDARARILNVLAGNIDLKFLNEYIIGPNFGDEAKIPQAYLDTCKKGLSFFLMGKTSLLGDLGARYFVIKDTFDVYSAFKAQTQSDNAYGAEQTTWLTTQLTSGTGTWKVLGSSVSFSPLVMDLRPSAYGRPALPAPYAQLDAALEGVPSPFNQRFYLNVDHWDGAVVGKKTMVGTMAARGGNVVSIGGDIHSHYVSKLADGVFDLTSSSVSSGTFGSYLDGGLDGLVETAGLSDADKALVEGLKPYYDVLMETASEELKVAKTREHGVAVATATAGKMSVTFYNLPTESADGSLNFVTQNLYNSKSDVLNAITERSYSVDNGANNVVIGS